MKVIGDNLTKFQYDTGKKPKEICAAMNISKSNYYKIREDGTSSIDFVLDFAEKYNYDLVNGQYLAENNSCIIFRDEGQDVAAARSALKQEQNFIIYDTNYRLLDEFGSWLEARGYDIRILNLCDLQKSNTYNPLHYLKNETEIYAYSEFLIKSILRKEELAAHEYELCIGLNALILFLTKNCPQYLRNLNSVMKLLQSDNPVPEDSKLDKIFAKIENNNLNPVAAGEFKIFSRKSAGELTRVLHELNIPKIQNLTATNNLCFEDILDNGDKKIALFLISNPVHQFDWLIESLTYHMAQNIPKDIICNDICVICPSNRIKNIFNKAITVTPIKYEIKQNVNSSKNE